MMNSSDRCHHEKVIMLLSECKVKEKVKVVCIKTRDERSMHKLTAMGILPGLTIRLLRKTPAYLFEMGESQFAVDKKLADKIQVQVDSK